MNLFDIFKSHAKFKNTNIGIGLGDSKEQNSKIFETSLLFLEEFKSTVFLFGNEKAVDAIKKHKNFKHDLIGIEIVISKNPEEEIINFLGNQMINAIVRGALSSHHFLEALKNYLDIRNLNRLALLETFNGYQFFYGPVGIDECNSIESKISFLKQAKQLLESLNIVPKISILSGGRLGDLGRDAKVDNSINIAKEVVEFLKKQYSDLQINHDEILIENAVEKKSNIIIAPDGISGNLIYRTLVHLGGGNAYGAIYMGLDDVIIDTSRVGKSSEIKGALVLALALTK
ncbi:MAG: hypothetical protein EU539_05370 [Promethearchaeota archaeon]|nr:MAG: hypothetical protein EU539_05370 [Candidatus Lokiarchaeota archaeon]